MKKIWPPLVLFLLAPVIGELLSGSAPPSEFFEPLPFFVLAILYGGGAILVRELAVRWNHSWYAILLLGAAYGIVEEGLMVKSYFDPLWQDIGILGYYGRWAGINWIWGIELTIYHSIISITIPILLTELVFPSVRHERWVGRGVITVINVCFTANVIFGNIFLTEYQPGILQYLLAIAAIIALGFVAWRISRWKKKPSAMETSVKNPLLFWLVGFTAMIGFILIFWVLPEFIVLPLVVVILAILMLAGYYWLVRRLSGNFVQWGDLQQLALAAGPLTFLMILAPILEINPNRTEDTTGMAIVGAVAFLMLMLLFWKTVKRMGVNVNG